MDNMKNLPGRNVREADVSESATVADSYETESGLKNVSYIRRVYLRQR